MNHKLEVVYATTADELQLMGMHYAPLKKTDTCIVHVHGLSGLFIEHPFANILGKTLAQNGFAYVYSHNRGYSYINEIPTTQLKPDNSFESRNYGSMYERFTKCPADIDTWLDWARRQGYTKLILLGHSMGATKVMYWWSQPKVNQTHLVGFIMASPADMIGLVAKKYSPKIIKETTIRAKSLIKSGQGTTLLKEPFDAGWIRVSAYTFLEGYIPDSPADVFPLAKNPANWEHLAKINLPTLCLFGGHDTINFRPPAKDLKIILKKAIGCPQFTGKIIPGAAHLYENRDKEFAATILTWVKTI